MEVAGLVFGVVGVAGLASAFRDTVNAVKTYKSSTADSDALSVQWDSQCLRLELWGESVGLGADGQILADHHRLLDHERITSSVTDLLGVITMIADPNAPLQQQGGGKLNQPRSRKGSAKTRLEKITWTLGGKGDRTEQVKRLGELIQLLHGLVPSGKSESRQAIVDEPTWLKDVRQTLIHAQAETRREVLAWVLGQHHQNERFDDSRVKRLPGTCDWILKHPVYTNWTKSNEVPESAPGVLWIHGRPGFGKTILCSRIVEHLCATPENIVGHYFFSSDHEGRDDPLHIAGSWLAQLASQPQVYEQICQKWEATDGQVATRSMVMEMMANVLQSTPGCFLVIDGLDECTASVNGDNSVGRFLRDILQATTPQTRVLVISRDEAEIRQALQAGGPDRLTEYQISPDDVHADTNAVSKSVIDKKLPKKSREVRANLAKTMRDRCEGQFLWLRLQERNLDGYMNARHLQRVLESTPAGLDQVYERNWNKIKQSPRSARAVALLRWSAFAVRPLTVGEITEAVLIVEDDDDLLADELPDEIDEDYIWKGVLELCAPLIEVRNPDLVPGSRTVHLTHFTVREFLVGHLPRQDIFRDNLRLASNELVQNTILARSCLWYMQSRHTWQPGTDFHGTQFMATFRDYAGNTWHAHVKSGVPLEEDSETLHRLLEFMSDSNASWTAWTTWLQRSLLEESRDPEEVINEGTSPEPPYYAFKLGLRQLAVSYIRKFGSRKLTDTSRGLEPLLRLCCIVDDFEFAELVLDEGTDVDPINGWERTPLHNASQHGSSKTALMLLDRGASVHAKDSNGNRPIDLAAANGHLEVVKSLVEKGANISIADGRGMTTLAWASMYGFLEVVEFLAEKGANIAAANNGGRTPVSWAALSGHFEVVRFLVNQGADISVAGENGRTPLLEACSAGKFELVRFLVNQGADISVADTRGRTPLFEACSTGIIEVIRLLIDLGADMEVFNKGLSPLKLATNRDRLDIIRVLVDKGADVSEATDDGWTPLLVAATKGDLEMIESFVEKGADISKADTLGRSVIFLASRFGHEHVVQHLLLDQRIDPRVKDWCGSTPLFAAVANGHIKVAKLLIPLYSSLSSCFHFGRTLLWWARHSGDHDMVELISRHSDQSSDSNAHAPTDSVVFESSSGWCDACTLSLQSTPWYGCRDCPCLALCVDCFERGIRCLNSGHGLFLRR